MTNRRKLSLNAHLQTCRVLWLCRKVRQQSLPGLLSEGLAMRALPSGLDAVDAEKAVLRMLRLLNLLRLVPDTCLVRTMAAGILLSDSPGVVMHMGFRPPSVPGEQHMGHAWLTLGGEIVIQKDTPYRSDGDYEEAATFALSRTPDESRSTA
jgi:hypothetical protein